MLAPAVRSFPMFCAKCAWPPLAVAKASVAPGMHLVAVNGKRFSKEVFHDAVRASKTRPVELLLENGDDFATYKLDYSGGERYPDLARDPSKPDLLSQIIEPLTRAPAAK